MSATIDVTRLSIALRLPEESIQAVDEVSFSIEPGKTVVLLGESGCGKSLMSHALMRLLPMNAIYGQRSQINFKSNDLLELPERLVRELRGKRLAMIFQEPMTSLNPVLTIEEQLGETGITHARMIQLLDEVEISESQIKLKQYPHQLSGGQKQRVMIAMALAHKPELLIADEPTTALDVTIQAQILKLLKKLQRQYEMSLLLITHNIGIVKAMADKVCVMYAGQFVEIAQVTDFFKNPLHPYSQQLLYSRPTLEKRNYLLQAIPGNVPNLHALPPGCYFHPRCAHAFAGCDRNKPLLQRVKSNREVRCHLYPNRSKLPNLPLHKATWTVTKMQKTVVYSTRALSVSFYVNRNYFNAVSSVSFDLIRGKTLALVGESGCGKSTLCRALLRLLPIQSGDALYQGQSIKTLRGEALRDFRKKVQIIFQDPVSSMNPRMRVGDILAEGMRAQRFSREKIKTRTVELLDQVNLPKEALTCYPHEFSGGQRQRICIARALATDPEIVICDEPTSALDISVQAQILNLLKQLQQDYNLSYLFVTHDMGVVSYLADEIMVMRYGKVVEQAECRTLFKTPQMPYTKKLLDSVLE